MKVYELVEQLMKMPAGADIKLEHYRDGYGYSCGLQRLELDKKHNMLYLTTYHEPERTEE